MRLKRTILALITTSALFLTGCAADDGDSPKADNPSSSDSGNSADGSESSELPTPDTADLPDVVASVNDVDITRETFLMDYEAQFDQAVAMGQGEALDQDALKASVVDMLINRELLIQAASADGIKATDEKIDEVLKDAATQLGLGSIDEFLELAAEQNIDAEAMREDAGHQYLINTYIDNNVEVADAPEEELREQYDSVVGFLKDQDTPEDEIPAFEDVRDQLNQEAKSLKMNDAVDGLLAKLREAADVSINL